jgi:hypothetical protein
MPSRNSLRKAKYIYREKGLLRLLLLILKRPVLEWVDRVVYDVCLIESCRYLALQRIWRF